MRKFLKIIVPILILYSSVIAQERVVDVVLIGNRHISKWEIIREMTLPRPRWYSPIFGTFPELNSVALQNDLSTIRSMYWDKGFLDVKARATAKPLELDSNRVQIKIFIEENERYKIGRIELSIPPGFDRGDAGRALDFHFGAPFSPYGAQMAKQRLARWIADQGYPYSEVSVRWTKLQEDTTRVYVRYEVKPGKKAHFGEITYKGLRKTKKFLLRRAIAVKTGEPYSYSKIEKSKEEIYSTNLFKIVSVDIADTSGLPDVVDIVISVVERSRGWYGFSLDFGSHIEYDLTGKLSAEWGHRNFFGNGQSISLRASTEGQIMEEQQLLSHRYEFVFYEPYTLAIKLPSTLTLYFEPGVRKEPEPWRVQKMGGVLQLVRRAGVITHWGGATYERADIFGVPENEAQEIKEEQGIYISRKLSYTYQRDSREDIFMPTNGSFVRFSTDFVGGLLGGDEHYLLMEFLWARYRRIPLWRSAIWANRLRFSAMGNTKRGIDVAVHNRLSLGGANSIRGFKELSIGPKSDDGTMLGGEVLGLYTSEIRFPIIWKFHGHFFIDMGQVWVDWRDVNPYDIRASIGFGLALATALGPLRVDHGIVLTRLDNPPYSRWHITLMYSF